MNSAAVPGLTFSTGFSAVSGMQAVGPGHTAATVLSCDPVRVCVSEASAAHGWRPVVPADGVDSVGKQSHGHSDRGMSVRGGKGRLAVLPRAGSNEQRAGGRSAGHPDHGTPDRASEVAGDINGCVFSRVFPRATPSKTGLLRAPSHSRVEGSVIDTSCSQSQSLDPSAHARTCTVPDPSGVAVAAAPALCASASSSGVASSFPRSFAAVAAALSSALAARAAEVVLAR